MRKLIVVIILLVSSVIVHGQSNATIQPQLEGYKPNDIVKYDDFIKNGKLVVDSKEYKVVGFTFMIWAGLVQEFKSDTCTITNEMRKILEELKSRGFKTSKIYFHDIKVRNLKGEVRITGDLIYKLKFN